VLARHRWLRVSALLITLSACSVSDLRFTNDHRLTFTSPEAREIVAAPLTISWDMEDFEPTGLDGSSDEGRGAFVVFVDRAPMPAGKDLKWVSRKDTACARDPRCPDEKYLEDRGIYVTTDTSVTLDVLPLQYAGVGNEQHYANVVLVDGSGRRIGESAWYLPFQSKRRSS
jgi:hypothetical protein